MKEEPVLRVHGVLVGSKRRQEMLAEVLEQLKRVAPSDWPREARRVDGAKRCNFRLIKEPYDIGHVTDKLERLWRRDGAWKLLSVLAVEIPLAAGWRSTVHQPTGASTHLAVEELHAQLLAATGPGGEGGRQHG